MGALVTDFMLIKPGACHRANGGYLMLDGAQVLMQPFCLGRAQTVLRAREIRIESSARAEPGEHVSTRAQPIPLTSRCAASASHCFIPACPNTTRSSASCSRRSWTSA